MASWAENNGLGGVGAWFYAQADEERLHMLKFVKYINERGGKAIIPAFKKPAAEYKSVEDVFTQVLKHEEFITSSINEIVQVTLEVKDYTTHSFLQWFVNEQIQEESSVHVIIDKLKLVGKNNMYIFDRDILGFRAAEAGANQMM
jgi:ferritin